VEFLDPDEGDGSLARQIAEEYGFQPMTTNLFSDERFYFYFVLSNGDTVVQLPPGEMTEEGFRRNLEAGIKRFASGFTRTVALVGPLPDPMYDQYGMQGDSFNMLRDFLGAELNVIDENLADGQVAPEADLLLLLAPQIADERQLYAIDQFLMQGGTVIIASSAYNARFVGNSLQLQPYDSGLANWLEHNGLRLENQLVLDPQSSPFPLPVSRDVGGFQVQEVQMRDYPYFIDVRDSGLNADNGITAGLPQVSMAWASPITVNETATPGVAVTDLLRSSSNSWLSDSPDVTPPIEAGGGSGFQAPGETASYRLGVVSEGRFDSYFADRDSPLLAAGDGDRGEEAAAVNGADEASEEAAAAGEQFGGTIERSPESARIILFGSNDFLKDRVIGLAGLAAGSEYLNSLQLMANAVDWSLEDRNLLAIRSRGHFNRTLPALDRGEQAFWEYSNYLLALAALGAIALLRQWRQRARRRAYLEYA